MAERIIDRAVAQVAWMIHRANHRPEARDHDPKVGGHPAACTSAAHILGALHLLVRRPEDWIAGKPHAAPMDHILQHHLGLFRTSTGTWMTADESGEVLDRLRAFSEDERPVLQSYHATSDPDHARMLPSGSVGLPAPAGTYLTLAEDWLEAHDLDLPAKGRLFALIGDAEFREGSLLEVLPEAAERRLGRVTWIIDYNRQSLDGDRYTAPQVFGGDDARRMARMADANGWNVIDLRHGSTRRRIFQEKGGAALRRYMERELGDGGMQRLLRCASGAEARAWLVNEHPPSEPVLSTLSDAMILEFVRDLGGHDLSLLRASLRKGAQDASRPTLIIAHTLKGWGLPVAADPGNHSLLLKDEQLAALLASRGLGEDDAYATFPEGSLEAVLLAERGDELRTGLAALEARTNDIRTKVREEFPSPWPTGFGIDLTLHGRAHTQWMWGQIVSKLARLALADRDDLPDDERPWHGVARRCLSLSPDVGTSTNTGFAMNGRVFGIPGPESAVPKPVPRRPDLTPRTGRSGFHLRFDIAEGAAMSALGALGKTGELMGSPLMPMLTIYDFFVKRALDQLFYDLYWNSAFLIVGSPSGVTLSFEGAQHSWKSDFQLPGLISWEPAFCEELEWILADTLARRFDGRDEGRRGVLLRCVTRTIDQTLFLTHLRQRPDFAGWTDSAIRDRIRNDVLSGAYRLLDQSGNAGYEPGDNVVGIFTMGALVTEALDAARELQKKGVLADIYVVTSPDLLVGALGRRNGYRHLREGLGFPGGLHLRSLPRSGGSHDLLTAAGSRVPVVTVVDGEPGLLDNIGGLLGTHQIALGCREFSKCGRPDQVYRLEGIDGMAIRDAAMQALAEEAVEEIHIHARTVEEALEAGRRPAIRPEDLL